MNHFIRRCTTAALIGGAVAAMGAAGPAAHQPSDHLEIFAPGSSGSSSPLQTIDFSVAVRDVAVDAHGQIFVADPAMDRVLQYDANATGNAKPANSIGGAATAILSPSAIAFDSRGDLLVANEGRQGVGASITVYGPGARGDSAPARTIAGALTGFTDPVGVAVDSHGAIYVIDATVRDVLVFAPAASGNQAPIRRLAVGGFAARELAVGADDDVYVFASDGPRGAEEIASFPHGNEAQITVPITGRGVYGANWISADSAGFLYVLSPGRVSTFAPKSSGEAQPASTLDVDFFLTNCCARMTAGADGKLYIYLTAFHWAA